jgi:hypothetical protein
VSSIFKAEEEQAKQQTAMKQIARIAICLLQFSIADFMPVSCGSEVCKQNERKRHQRKKNNKIAFFVSGKVTKLNLYVGSGALLPPPTLKFWNDSNLRSCV